MIVALRIVANVIFCIWCAVLALVAVIEFGAIKNSSGDATGSLGDVFLFVIAAGLLILSMVVRGIVWWLCP